MKKRTTDRELLKAHDEAWKAMVSLPIYQEMEALYARLASLETWQPGCESFEEHITRHAAGRPRDIQNQIRELRNQLYKTPESTRWFELYQKLYV